MTRAFIDLLPDQLGPDGRRIKAEMKSEGIYSDVMQVLRRCKEVIRLTQKRGTPVPSFVNPFPDPGNRPYGRKWKMAPVCPGSLPLTIPLFLPVEGVTGRV